jgi:DNA adenine methylase
MNPSKTPLRYPGGKQRLAPFLTEILIANKLIGGHYVEPYAGGAGAALELLLSDNVSHVHLNDASYAIYCFWHSVLNNTERLCKMISAASLTVDEWKRQREAIRRSKELSMLEVGFATFFLNRCNHSGVLSGGLIGGLTQAGDWKMDARFSRNELIGRIEAVAYKREAININNDDAETYIKEYIPRTPAKTLVYLDPPYFEKSRGLYLNTYKKHDHERIATVIQEKIKRNWVLSYDGAKDILSYYKKRKHFLYNLQYSAATIYEGREVFVFCDKLKLPERSVLKFVDKGLLSMGKKLTRNLSA